MGVYAALKALADSAPHDLWRLFAQMADRANAPIEQIQLSLAYASVATTERYLGQRKTSRTLPATAFGYGRDLTTRSAGPKTLGFGAVVPHVN